MTSVAENHHWLQRTHEDALEPALPICDPHHHFWVDRPGATQVRYLADEFLADIENHGRGPGHNIVSSVFIECGAQFHGHGQIDMRVVGETEFVRTLGEKSDAHVGSVRMAPAIIGTVDLKIGARAADVLDAHLEAAGGRFRGIRLGAFWHESDEIRNHRTNPPKHLLLQEDFRAGFDQLASRKLTFEAWVCHEQIDDVIDLARTFPETIIILDHLGGPLGAGRYKGRRDEVFEVWRGSIKELAACENVRVKLGGLNMDVNGFGWEDRENPPSSQELAEATRPYIETGIEFFGVERAMFESNFPVDKMSCDYTVLWNSFKRLTAAMSSSERRALFHDTAAAVYRI